MSSEIEWLDPGEPSTDTRKRCKYCLRVLVVRPTKADEAKPHCQTPMCRWCHECYAGETSVSPRNK